MKGPNAKLGLGFQRGCRIPFHCVHIRSPQLCQGDVSESAPPPKVPICP